MLCKKGVLEISQNSQENTCTRVLRDSGQVFSREFWEFFKNGFFTEHLRASASVKFEVTNL